MSTIKVTNLQNASAASPAIVLDANSRATLNGLSYPTEGSLSGRNRIINGDMRIDQRNAGASFSASAGIVTYGVDRFYLYQTGAAVTGQRISSGLTDFPNALRVTGASGSTSSEVSQRIESVNCADLVGQAVTVSFTAAHSGNGTLNVALVYANAADNWSGSTAIQTRTQVLTSTLTRYSLSFNALPAGVANGLLLVLSNASGLGSGVTFTITGVQLEAGSVATPFERRSYGQELALCQRYFHRMNTGRFVMGYKRHDAACNWFYQSPVPMRATPTLTLNTAGNFTNFQSSFGSTQSSPSVYEYSTLTGNGVFLLNSTWASTHTYIPSYEGFDISFSSEL